MNDLITSAIALCAELLGDQFDDQSRRVAWRRRKAGIPTTAGDPLSTAFGQKDFQDSYFAPLTADSDAYELTRYIYCSFEKPSQLAGQDAVNIVAGQAVAYFKADSGVAEYDLITDADGHQYIVTGVRKPTPFLYVIATLQRTA